MKQIQRAVVYAPNGARLGPIPTPTEYGFSSPLSEISGATMSYRDGTVGAEALRSLCEVGFEYSQDNGLSWTEYPNGRFLRLGRSADEVQDSKVRSYTLPGFGWQLNKVRQNKTVGLNADGKRPFNSANAGMIMKTLLDEAHDRGVVTSLLYDFTTSVDSNGQPWNKIISIAYEPGLELFTILNNLSAQGLVDWYFQGRTLRMFNADGFLGTLRDVKLQAPTDLQGLPAQGTYEDFVHQFMVLGDAGKRLTLAAPGVPAPWGRWEGFQSQGGVSDTTTMTLLIQAQLDQNARERMQYTAEINVDTTTYEPFVHYGIGDYVTLPTEAGTQPFRVRQFNFSKNGEGELSLSLIINDRFVEKELRNARRVNGITGGAGAGGNGSPPTKDPGLRKPKTPVGLIVGSEAIINGSGFAEAWALLQYPATTADVNDVALEIARYEFRGRQVGATAWRSWGYAADLDHTYGPLTTGQQVQVQYRAVSSGGTPSDWSAISTATLASDVTPPPKPSTPILTTRLGTLTIKWNGRDSTNAYMPRDFDRVLVYQLGEAEPIGSIFNNRTPMVLTDVVIGTSYEFWFVGVDHAGNAGVESDHATITVASIMDDPQAALDIQEGVNVATGSGNINTYSPSTPPSTGNENRRNGDKWFQLTSGVTVGVWRYDLATTSWVVETLGNATVANLDAGKITTGTLAAARIASGAITADKIDAGAVTAVKLAADAIDGKTITGVNIFAGALYTGTRSGFDTGVGLYVSNAGYFSVRSDGRRMLTCNPATGDVMIGTPGQDRCWWDNASRMRIYRAGESLPILDINPGAASQNMRFGGAVFVDALNVGDAMAGTVRGIITGTSAGLELSTTGNLNIGLEPGGSGQVRSTSVYAQTVAYNPSTWGERYMAVNTNGQFVRIITGSSRELKANIKDADIPATILDVSPRTWFWKENSEKYADLLHREAKGEEIDPEEYDYVDKIVPDLGFIAEELEDAGLHAWVHRNGPNGEITSVSYDRLWIALIPVMRELRARVAELEGRN